METAEDAQQDQEEVDEVEVETERQQQRVVVASPLRLDPPEVEERQPDENDPEEDAEGEVADRESEDQGGEADDDADEEGAQQVLAPGRHVDAGQVDDRSSDQEDTNGAKQCAADRVGRGVQVVGNDRGDEEAFNNDEQREEADREALVLASGRRLDPKDQADGDDEVEQPGDVLWHHAGDPEVDAAGGEGEREGEPSHDSTEQRTLDLGLRLKHLVRQHHFEATTQWRGLHYRVFLY